MKKYALIFTILILSGVWSVLAYGSDNVKVEAQGAVLMDYKTGRVLWEKNSTEPLAMASTTKIMTAIIALENGKLGDTVTVSNKAAVAPEVKMHLRKDEKISLKDLLYALMLESHNDAAVAVAEHISGDVESFCALMTQKAKEIGALDTVFETPNGLDKGEHHSTAYDMALITAYALSNETFVGIINTPYYSAASNLRTYSLTNKNRLLHEFDGALGVKTGFTGKAGHCFVGAAQRDGMRLISVVLASGWGDRGKQQKWTDTKALLNYGFENYHYVDIIKEDVELKSVPIMRSRAKDLELYLEQGLMLPLSGVEEKYLRIEYSLPETVMAPVEKDAELGKAKIYVGNDLIKEIAIRAADGAERHDFETSLKKVISNWLNMSLNEAIKL